MAAVLVAACLALAASALAVATPRRSARRAQTLSALARSVLDDINALRRRRHLAPLRLSAELDASARQHSDEMAADGYFAHPSADGTAFWKRIQRYYGSSAWSYWSVGENLLWSSPEVDAAHALALWLGSPEHRANLLAPRWRQIGVSAVHVTDAPGVYHGLDVTIITTDFGVRR